MFEEELVELEKLYRYKTSIRTPHFDGIECYRIDGVYQRQFFVLDKCESKTDIIDAGIDMPPAGVGFYNCVFKGIVNFDESIVPEKSVLEYFTMQLLSKC